MISRNILTVTNLKKSFKTKNSVVNAVNDVSFVIKEGEIFGLLGPNGAGKTTIISMISCLTIPDSGDIILNKYDVKKNQTEVKKLLGVVPQFNSLDEDLTAYENLFYYALYYGIKKNEAERVSVEIIKLIGLEDKKNMEIRNFSGGMQQRLLVGRGLVANPKLLILDEPTIGLDPQARRVIWKYIQEFKKKGISILLTTHYLDEADSLCDRIAIIDHGKILMIDTPKNLKKKVLSESKIDVKINKLNNSVTEMLVSELKNISGVVEVIIKGIEVLIYVNQVMNCLSEINRVLKKHTSIIHMNIQDMSLDDVFIKLTGEEVRDGN